MWKSGKKEQSFCNKCGKHLQTSTQRKSENQIEHMREQQSYISREKRQDHDSTFYNGQKHTGWLIVLSIIFVLLIAALLYGAYYATIIILVMSKVIKQHSLNNQMKVIKIATNLLVQALMF